MSLRTQPQSLEQAFEAVNNFNRLKCGISSTASAMAGKRVTVVAGSPTRTDGSTIWIVPPWKLGLKIEHDTRECGNRGSDGFMICESCKVREEVLTNLYHEVGHVILNTFEKLKNSLATKIQPEVRRTIGPLYARIWNCVEDAVINRRICLSHGGIGEALIAEELEGISEGMHGELETLAQLVLGTYSINMGYTLSHSWDASVLDFYKSEDAQKLVRELNINAYDMQSHLEIICTKWLLLMEKAGFFSMQPPSPEPEDAEPEDAEPEDAEPEDAEPEDAEPEDAESDSGAEDAEPEDAEPDSGAEDAEPDSGADGAAEPEDAEPEDAEPEDAESDSGAGGAAEPDSGAGGAAEPDSGAGGAADSDTKNTDTESTDSLNDSDDSSNDSGSDQDSDDSFTGDVNDNFGSAGDTDSADSEDDENTKSEPKEIIDEGNGLTLLELLKKAVTEAAEQLIEAREEMHGHDEAGSDSTAGTLAQKETVAKMIDLAEWTSSPGNVSGIQFVLPNKWRSPRRDIQVPESLVGSTLLQARKTFFDNDRAKSQHNLRSGRVDRNVLGSRGWNKNDGRVFHKRSLPKNKDYKVLIGVDMSGSTYGEVFDLEITAVAAMAELLSRVGIDFSIMGHDGETVAGKSYYQSDFVMRIHRLKEFGAPWNKEAVAVLNRCVPFGYNLDGHTLEVYRTMLLRERAERRVLFYFTDGELPAANAADEKRTLDKVIPQIRRDKIALCGVGIYTDSPKKYGMPMAQLDEMTDIKKALTLLESQLF